MLFDLLLLCELRVSFTSRYLRRSLDIYHNMSSSNERYELLNNY